MNDSDPLDVTQDAEGKPLPQAVAAQIKHPQRIGRYRIEKVLGKGGFGLVYLAHDEQLDRLVAIKVPHAKLIAKPEDAEAYLAEARTVANLDHPGIVPVHDVGSTEDCPCYVVSKYIEGTDLSVKIKESRLKYRDAAELVATVAEALHYAHKQGLVHRDVKPGNILIGKDGQPFVVDFGLALREENIGKGPKYAGTPAYMSPEQARGEGHRVDGRSDIFSLGGVFYELLVGRQPFRGDTHAELFEQVASYEPRPPRQYDDRIPKELERICHKAMAKRASERYSTAKDFAEDLRLFMQEQAVIQSGTSPGGIGPVASETFASQGGSTAVDSAASSGSIKLDSSDSQPIRIVPKGLRSFDAHDADFFLELLPGPRDREGLPDSLRFWKTRIEEPDPDNTFSVGLIYGPSGCGKSSLVKAGLLPRLSEDVIPVYIEATPEETETRLLHGLRKRCPSLEDNLSLKDTLAALRRGQGIPVGKKVLIVLDQFEQWLHAKKEEENTDLVQALRQCDGGRVQCVVMVRDDFWMAVTRFLRELEVRLLEDQNLAAVDLFPERHAQEVLAAFGRAFGTLPDDIGSTTKEQKDFLKQSVEGLAEEGKVICVRLALFAEMMKGKEWTAASLKEVGGTKGVGVTFLEETFSSSAASPDHRYHQKAARAVLRDLLPNSGTDIKGYMRSHAELMEASGYGNRPKDFDDLVRILDSEIRLITPTDPEGKDADDDSITQTQAGQKYFQLTHDYLVHSLRDWLTRKQKETRKGRAELNLFDTAVTWNAKPENRFLPSWWENLNIRLFTDKQNWTEPQRKMMGKAGGVHGLRSGLVGLCIVLVVFAGLFISGRVEERQNANYAKALVESLSAANTADVKDLVVETSEYQQWVTPLLAEIVADENSSPTAKLHASLALVKNDPSQVDFLLRQLLVASPDDVPVIVSFLAPHKDQLKKRLWDTIQTGSNSQRIRAAAALSQYDGEDKQWEQQRKDVVTALVSVPASESDEWIEMLRPVGGMLADPLEERFRDRSEKRSSERPVIAAALSVYLKGKPKALTPLILLADNGREFQPLLAALRNHSQSVIPELKSLVSQSPPKDAEPAEGDAFWKKQANAAVCLLELGETNSVWPLFQQTPNPSLRSLIIDRLARLGATPGVIAKRIKQESDSASRYALTLTLGQFDARNWSSEQRRSFTVQMATLYREDPDPGVHSAAGWTLRQWGSSPPDLPVGELSLSEKQKQRRNTLATQIDETKRRIEEERASQIAQWGQKISRKYPDLPSSLENDLLSLYQFDTLGDTASTPEKKTLIQLHGDTKPQKTNGVIGQAVALRDGAYATGNPLTLDTEKPFSIGGWFLFREKERSFGLLSNRDKNDRLQGLEMFYRQPGQIILHLNSKTGYIRCDTKNRFEKTNCWYHILATYDGTKTVDGIRIYVNGKPQELIPGTEKGISPLEAELIESPVPLHFGTRPPGLFSVPSTPLDGAIDEVRVYDRLLTDMEIEHFYWNGVGKVASAFLIRRTFEFENTLLVPKQANPECFSG